MFNLFDVTLDHNPHASRRGGKDGPRQPNAREIEAYLRWMAGRIGVDIPAGARFCPGGIYTPDDKEPLFPMPHVERDANVTLEVLDESGAVIATSTLPIEPKKGGIIWSRADVRKAHGPVAKPAKSRARKCAPVVEKTPEDTKTATLSDECGETAPMADSLGYFIVDTKEPHCPAVSYHSTYEAAQQAHDALEPVATYSSTHETGGQPWRYMVEAERGESDCRRDLYEISQRHHAEIAAIKASNAAPAAEIDPIAEIMARLEATESRVSALSAELKRPREKRSPAHARAIRRAWAERKARRQAEAHLRLGREQFKSLEISRDAARADLEDAQHSVEILRGEVEHARRIAINNNHKRRRAVMLARRRGRDIVKLARALHAMNGYLDAARRTPVYMDADGREGPDHVGRAAHHARMAMDRAEGLERQLGEARAAVDRQAREIGRLGDAVVAATARAVKAEAAARKARDKRGRSVLLARSLQNRLSNEYRLVDRYRDRLRAARREAAWPPIVGI